MGGAIAGAAALSGCRLGGGSPREFLTGGEAGVLAILCDAIIPADAYPSATQAGVLTFIDRQLVRHYAQHQDAYRAGLREFAQRSRMRFHLEPTALSAQQQFELAAATEREDARFFELVRRHTLQGYYGSPRHGGNRDAVSWHMLGLDEPPLRGRAQYDLNAGLK